jgi:hypothetical protein
MIRPVVRFKGEYWYFEVEECRLAQVKDTKVCVEIDTLTRVELEELSDSVMELEREVCDATAVVDGALDVLDYTESFGQHALKETKMSKWLSKK